jgi:cbb3-type cytochrome oxidase subunit 3
MNPYEFEKLVAKVWEAQGYETTVRKGSNDKAVDVEAVRGNHKILIQAKRYNSSNKIGGPAVRKYATLYQQDSTADQVVIVTTSSFTSQAKEIGAEQNVTLIDGYNLVNFVNKNNILSKRTQKSSSKRRRNATSNRQRNTTSQNVDNVDKVDNTTPSLVTSVLLGIPTSIGIATAVNIFTDIIVNSYVLSTSSFALIYLLSVAFWMYRSRVRKQKDPEERLTLKQRTKKITHLKHIGKNSISKDIYENNEFDSLSVIVSLELWLFMIALWIASMSVRNWMKLIFYTIAIVSIVIGTVRFSKYCSLDKKKLSEETDSATPRSHREILALSVLTLGLYPVYYYFTRLVKYRVDGTLDEIYD